VSTAGCLEEVNNKKEKKMKKLNIETIKTIIITILITGIIAFIGGMYYQKHQTEQVKAEAATIVKNVKVEVSKQ
jgi:predicted negative regulator of RcsB-dependent stress response